MKTKSRKPTAAQLNRALGNAQLNRALENIVLDYVSRHPRVTTAKMKTVIENYIGAVKSNDLNADRFLK